MAEEISPSLALQKYYGFKNYKIRSYHEKWTLMETYWVWFYEIDPLDICEAFMAGRLFNKALVMIKVTEDEWRLMWTRFSPE